MLRFDTLPLLPLLENKRNLLAFSAGSDSSALYHLLDNAGICFDIALVNYATRPASDEEADFAQRLAQRDGKRCYIRRAPAVTKNFEAHARRIRYAFFDELVRQHGYDNLITAHHLNDRVEWMLMRLVKGAGIAELTGMQPVDTRRGYPIVRPLLDTPKHEIEAYLQQHHIPHFIDETNDDVRFERNRLRPLVNTLVNGHAEGIVRSFDYLREDTELLLSLFETVVSVKQLRVVRLFHPHIAPKAADMTLKTLGYMLSGKERRRLHTETSVVAGRQWAIEKVDTLLYIAPYLPDAAMPKPFKERCRLAGIPPKIRPYLYREEIDPEHIRTQVATLFP